MKIKEKVLKDAGIFIVEGVVSEPEIRKQIVRRAVDKYEAEVGKVIDDIEIDLKYPDSATESERILMKQIVDIFKRKLKQKLRIK